MKNSYAIAVGLVFSVVFSSMAQDAAALNALFLQAAQLEAGDSAGAVRLYQQAVSGGHTPSMVRLGYLRQTGTGVPRDLAEAFSLFNRAARAGDPDGQFFLAMCYLQGVGTTRNPEAARQWLLQPASGGHQFAQYTLGTMLVSGEGGPKREAAARRWMDKATAGPDRNLAARAADFRDKIDKNIFAPDNSAGMALTALLFMALVGAAMGGDGGGGSSTSSSSSTPFPSGGRSSSSPPPCHPVPMPVMGGSMTPNGRNLVMPRGSFVMGGC